MEQFRMWRVVDGDAIEVEHGDRAETEGQLEAAITHCPAMLGAGFEIVGRQVPTRGRETLDLLGVDRAGTLVVVEVKRERLTREAVAQALDYTAYIRQRDTQEIINLIEERSGRLGVRKFEDFRAWYVDQFPVDEEQMEELPNARTVLVGVGADQAASAIVEMLASQGTDISFVSFDVFREEESHRFVRATLDDVDARKVSATRSKRGPLHHAEEHRVRPIYQALLDVLDDVDEPKQIQSFEWTHRLQFTITAPGHAQEGKLRFVAGPQVHGRSGRLWLRIYLAAIDDAQPEFEALKTALLSRGIEFAVRPESSIPDGFALSTLEDAAACRAPLLAFLNAVRRTVAPEQPEPTDDDVPQSP